MAKKGEDNIVHRRGPPVVGRKRKFGSLRKILDQTAERKTGIKELETDCLINVLKRTGMESLLLSVPFVCKAWHEATLNPLCWQHLSFSDFLPFSPFEPTKISSVTLETLTPFYVKYVEKYQVGNTARFSITVFVRMIVARSHGKALEIKLPGFIDEETLRYVADTCPGIRVLSLLDDLVLFRHSRVLAELIGKWKGLEELHLGGNLKKIYNLRADLDWQKMNELSVTGDFWVKETIMEDILKQVEIHCKNLVGFGISHGYKLDVTSIVKSLPNVKHLWFEECHLEIDNLYTLLNGCNQLELLSVAKCGGSSNTILGYALGNVAAEACGVEFILERSEDCHDEDYYYSLDAQIMSRKLLTNKGRRHPRMRTGGFAPRGLLAPRT